MWMSFRSMQLALLSVVAGLAFGAHPARAAPQSLALVATHGGIELNCQGGECGAEFSTFCLQTDRNSPAPGTAYWLATGDVRLIGTTGDGRRVVLDAKRHLKFESLRSHLAMRISVPSEALDQHGLKTVAVIVGENVALLPGGDAGSDTRADVAVLEQSLRPLGTLLVDRNPNRMTAARIANRVINRLPGSGRAEVRAGKAAWRRAIAEEGIESPADRGAGMARKAFDFCEFAASRGVLRTLRSCLQHEHDRFVNFLNSAYWQAIETGS